jgi:hypothetical protein
MTSSESGLWDEKLQKKKALDRWDDEGGAAESTTPPPGSVQDEHRRGDTQEQSDWARGRDGRNVPGAAPQPRPAPRTPPESAGIPKGGRTERR